jgi:sensor histidine kinase YesM
MILQPLMENSIRHGLADRARGGRIEVESRRSNGMLYLRIRDDGIGLPSNEQAPSNNSVGLANTRARLEHLYGQTHRFDLSASPGGGLTVNIAIPFREHEGKTDEISYLDR